MPGFSEIQNQQPPARFGHAPHLPQTLLPTGKIAQTIPDGHDVEVVVEKRQALSVAMEEARRGGGDLFCAARTLLDRGRWVFGFRPLASDRQHWFAEIQSDHVRAAPRQ